MLPNQYNNESRGIRRTIFKDIRSRSKEPKNKAGVDFSDTVLRREFDARTTQAFSGSCGNFSLLQDNSETSEQNSTVKCKEEIKRKDYVNYENHEPSKTIQEKDGLCDFSEPKLLTSLKIIESFHSLVTKDCKKKPSSSHGSSISAKKATRKVNIPFDEKVYKGLIDLKVNDEELGLDLHIPLKPKEIVKVKEPEPVLSDYYTPTFNKEYFIKPKPPTVEMTKFKMPELPSVYQTTKRWEPDEFY